LDGGVCAIPGNTCPAPHYWDGGVCQLGFPAAISGPTVCHHTSEGHATCEAGSVRGSGWISVKGMNGTTVDPGCKQVRPELEHCVDTNATKGNETNTNATGKQSQTNATTMGNLTEPAATTGAGAILFTVYFFPN